MQNLVTLAHSLSAVERKILPYLRDGITVSELMQALRAGDAEIKRALMWLQNREVLTTHTTKQTLYRLGAMGELAATYGLPEHRLLEALQSGPLSLEQLESDIFPRQEIMATIGLLKQQGLLEVQKTPQGLIFSAQGSPTPSPLLPLLEKTYPLKKDSLSAQDQQLMLQALRRKDFIIQDQETTIVVELTELGKQLLSANIDLSEVEEQLTQEMLRSGEWKEKTFRTYDVTSSVPEIIGGRRHPYREAVNLLRDVYLQMGFQEMSGPWVETAFWCMDSMWIPQDHPARDEQDTFFIGMDGTLPEAFVEKVKAVHENGAETGSTGHGAPWNPALARQLILRTHSTATTFRTLASPEMNTDGKYFYIANVFRNEAVDATHLAEFLQAEGFVVGDHLTLADLMGFIKEFYARLGIHKIRFKPTYNPYTEPSLEAHYYDDHKKKWYALINSGIFRPESLYPFGINKTVIAWGMGASRVASLLNHKQNLRELVGPQVDIHWIATHKSPQPDLEN